MTSTEPCPCGSRIWPEGTMPGPGHGRLRAYLIATRWWAPVSRGPPSALTPGPAASDVRFPTTTGRRERDTDGDHQSAEVDAEPHRQGRAREGQHLRRRRGPDDLLTEDRDHRRPHVVRRKRRHGVRSGNRDVVDDLRRQADRRVEGRLVDNHLERQVADSLA